MSQFYLEMKNISKKFGSVSALKNVNLKCKKGEIHVLIGENGAGKSTILKILSGIYQQNSGTIELDGKQLKFNNPMDAQSHGIDMVFQELTLVNELTVVENIFLGKEIKKFGKIDYKRQSELLKKCMDEYGIAIDPDAIVDRLSVAQKQLVEILKVLIRDPEIIIFDEPTSSLAKNEVKILFEIMRKLKENNKVIIYISHRMEEIFEIGDVVTVFKDGEYIDNCNIKDIDVDQLINMMVGRTLDNIFPPKQETESEEVILEVNNLKFSKNSDPISFEVHRGEILGVAGLQGHGQTKLLNSIAGVVPLNSGKVIINGKDANIKSSKNAIKEGVALIPVDRKQEGLLLSMSIRQNIALASLDSRSTCGLINAKDEKQLVNEYKDKLNIKMSSMEQEVGQLSGGNQQKVVLGKELAIKPNVILFNEPTRGIDVEAKREFYYMMRQLADDGVAVVMYSNDLMEVIGMSDRVMVMYENAVTGFLNDNDIDEVSIMRLACGIDAKEDVDNA